MSTTVVNDVAVAMVNGTLQCYFAYIYIYTHVQTYVYRHRVVVEVFQVIVATMQSYRLI